MNHVLFVGFFERDNPQLPLKVRKPINMNAVTKVISEMNACDSADRDFSNDAFDANDQNLQHICRIQNETLYYKSGYLVCPWLGIGINKKSVDLICRLSDELGCDIFCPDDAVFYSRDELHAIEQEFNAAAKAGQSNANA